jgi:hypothetical protein
MRIHRTHTDIPAHRVTAPPAWRVLAGMAAAALLATGCGSPQAPAASGTAQAATPAAAGAPHPTAARATAANPAPSGDAGGLAGRTGELTNPDNPTMVFLYHDLAGIAAPIDQWVEKDNRVTFARGPDKATQRTVVRNELQAGMAGVRGVGVIHLTLNGRLSDYDPTYGEFTIGALSPGSVVTFKAFNEQVGVKFANGLTAQTWAVPADKAHAIEDLIGRNASISLEIALRIDKVQPGPGGGTIIADVMSYQMRDPRGGTIIGRVQLAGK